MSVPLFHYLLIHWLIAFIPIGLGIFVFLKSKSNPLYQAFLRYNFVISWWGLFNLFMEYSKSEGQALFWDRVSLLGIVYIPATFLHFTWMHSGKSKLYGFGIRSCYLLSTIFFVFVFTPWMAKSATPKYIIPYFTDPGFLYHFFVFYFVSVMTFGNILVLKAYFAADSRARKTGARLFLIATSIATIGGGGNFMVPYEIYIPILYPYGGYSFILYGLLITYAILRYKFLDMEAIIKRTLVFAGIVTATACMISIPAGFVQLVLGRAIGIPPFWLLVSGIITTALIYRPLERWLVIFTDRFLFQKKFDYRKVLKYASQGLSRVNSLKYQLKLVTCFLTMRARIKTAAVYMPENENGDDGKSDFILKEFRAFDRSESGPDRFAFNSQIVTYLGKETRKPYLEYYDVENLARKHKRDRSNIYRYDFEELRAQMSQRKAFLIVASYYQDRLQGILMLGEKRSEEPYTEEDFSLFQTIAQETAIAFENARKHDRLVAQKEELAAANAKLKEAQAEIIQAKEEAAVAELSGGISHDVNNGIYAMSDANERAEEALNGLWTAFKDVYNSNQPISAPQKIELFDYLENTMVAVNQNKEAAKHIEDVARTLSQIAKGERAQMARLNVRTFIKGMVRIGALRTYTNRLKAQAFEEEPEVAMPNDLPPIYGHAQLLKAVFVNLFKNAIDAMDNVFPKKLKIKARRDPEDPERVRIEFSDNGCGISKEHLPRIFDYEFTTKGSFGEGKGLFNVKTIIENQHQGKVEVESELGKGTTFILKIPVYKGQDLKDFEK